ncbi:Uncharacterised protein [Chryseobacterium indoltheticum]|uniref:Uncharacterized protein n=1 Tax=Chryseobacterium indoltheticum TaxID=254 RepID=A0A381FFB0_9FLAO|nr:Uncharacterised protein [Chryseobacterium indoltheticum]
MCNYWYEVNTIKNSLLIFIIKKSAAFKLNTAT